MMLLRVFSVRQVACAAGLALALSACANPNLGLQELRGGIEMGVRRGAAWTTLTVKPPYVIGARTNLSLKNSVFSGSIEGRPVKLYVEKDGIHGQGPFGNVNVVIYDGPDSMTIEGTWNDYRVHFKVTAESFRGVIAVWNDNAGLIRNSETCQYVLDKVDQDGSRMGSSICFGMPEDTRIEVPGPVQDWLTRQELTVVLLALLSSPPTTVQERRGPPV
ncbi:MAG: hypothetical protein SF187_11435 [Deltaproteobacteria bacterium]|nr:hypothetical protein [Deltaproteobacteria bacterium]